MGRGEAWAFSWTTQFNLETVDKEGLLCRRMQNVPLQIPIIYLFIYFYLFTIIAESKK